METKIGFNDLSNLSDVHRFSVMSSQVYLGRCIILSDTLVFFVSIAPSQSGKEKKCQRKSTSQQTTMGRLSDQKMS